MTEVSRRGFLAAAGAGAVASGAAGRAGAQENETGGNATAGGNQTDGDGGEGDGGGGAPEPDFGGWFGDVPYFDGVTDERGNAEVTVAVGAEPNNALSFLPAAVHVDPGTTVVWEWTGDGGSHNVVHTDGDFESDLVGQAGATFEHTFEEDGVYNYFCDPHRSAGMKGSVVVGTDYPAVETPGGDGDGPQYVPDSAKTLGMATTFVMLATLGLAYVFIKYGGSGPREE